MALRASATIRTQSCRDCCRAALAANLTALMQQPRAPALELHPEGGVRYERVTAVLAAAHNAGVQQIGIAPVND